MGKSYQIRDRTQFRNLVYSGAGTDFDLVAGPDLAHIPRDVDAEVMESGANPEQTRCGNW